MNEWKIKVIQIELFKALLYILDFSLTWRCVDRNTNTDLYNYKQRRKETFDNVLACLVQGVSVWMLTGHLSNPMTIVWFGRSNICKRKVCWSIHLEKRLKITILHKIDYFIMRVFYKHPVLYLDQKNACTKISTLNQLSSCTVYFDRLRFSLCLQKKKKKCANASDSQTRPQNSNRPIWFFIKKILCSNFHS